MILVTPVALPLAASEQCFPTMAALLVPTGQLIVNPFGGIHEVKRPLLASMIHRN